MARVNPIPGPSLGLHSHPSLYLPEAATQTYKSGAVLVKDGSGYLVEAAANPVDIAGIAMQPGLNGTLAGDKYTRLHPALPHSSVVMSLDKAAGLGRVTVQADLLKRYGITKDADGRWYVDIDKTGANARVVVVGFIDDVGTASGRVAVIWLPTTTQFA